MNTRALPPLVALLLAAAGPALSQVPGTIMLPEPASPFVAFNVWVKVGSQHDPKGKEGLAALTANLLAQGSTTADRYDQILAKLYPMAAGWDYSVDGVPGPGAPGQPGGLRPVVRERAARPGVRPGGF